MNAQTITNEARAAAINAEQSFIAKHGEMAYCGFAWVDVQVERTNSAEAKALLAVGFKKSYRPKTLSLWTCGGYNGQSMDVKEAGAMAYVLVLAKHGYTAFMGSRAD
jgi:hypothetical protein